MLSLNEILEQLEEEDDSLKSVDYLLSKLDEVFNSTEVKDILAEAVATRAVTENKTQSFSQHNAFF